MAMVLTCSSVSWSWVFFTRSSLSMAWCSRWSRSFSFFMRCRRMFLSTSTGMLNR